MYIYLYACLGINLKYFEETFLSPLNIQYPGKLIWQEVKSDATSEYLTNFPFWCRIKLSVVIRFFARLFLLFCTYFHSQQNGIESIPIRVHIIWFHWYGNNVHQYSYTYVVDNVVVMKTYHSLKKTNITNSGGCETMPTRSDITTSQSV